MRLLVTYMVMDAPPPGGLAMSPPRPDASIRRERPGIAEYRALYRAVGDAVQWDDHRVMDDATLAAFLGHERVDTYVLRLGERAMGLCQFDRRVGPDVELTHFGIVPEVYGHGLGPYLLDAGLRAVWDSKPRRVWLHTDTNDHPAARAAYERAGLRVDRQQWEDVPDWIGLADQ